MLKSSIINIVFVGIFLSYPLQIEAQIEDQVFLANTDHELHVYRVFGDEPGNTMMIIGGIQGDEPSGYITADLYADIHLRKGNLIVIPRANFYSILINNRYGVTGDMNRKFGGNPGVSGEKESRIVRIIKNLIKESDCLLNLHEGSGYYNPDWISSEENPRRYGQSIIYDSEIYQPAGTGVSLNLGRIAKAVVKEVNSRIEYPRYYFRANNHDTISKMTKHMEQRQSATFYALTQAHIPAFGIEISKKITSLEARIRLHKLVINVMMEQFGIELDAPGGILKEPKLDYLLVKVNDSFPIALTDNSILALSSGDQVTVTGIIANYKRGLSADIAGFGTSNDTNSTFIFEQPTRVVVKKDASVCGWVDLVLDNSSLGRKVGKKSTISNIPSPTKPLSVSDLTAESLIISVVGENKKVKNFGTLSVPSNSTIILQAINTNISMLDGEVVVNFKGYVPPKPVNDGNDMHYPINTARDLWKKYSEKGAGSRYPISVTYLKKVIGQFWVELEDNN